MQVGQGAMALAVLVATSVAATSGASAQDAMASNGSPHLWDGLFNDAFIGARFATSRQDFDAQGTSTGNFAVGGVTGGIGFGYAREHGRFLIGVEADVSGNSSDGVAHSPNPTYDYETENNWLGIVDARLGYDLGLPLLPYATAGFAVGDVRAHAYRPQGSGNFVDYTNTEDRVPWSGVTALGRRDLRQAWPGYCQAATAGSLTKGSSLRGATLSRVM